MTTEALAGLATSTSLAPEQSRLYQPAFLMLQLLVVVVVGTWLVLSLT